MGVEDHLLALAHIWPDEHHPAVAGRTWATLTLVLTPLLKMISWLQSDR